MAIELMQTINDYLVTKFTPFSTINEDFTTADGEEELMCRHDISPLIVKKYMNGTEYRRFNFSYFARSKNSIRARQQLESVQEAIYLDHFVDMLGLKEGRLTVVSQPHPVGKDDSGAIIYTSAYALDYKQEA